MGLNASNSIDYSESQPSTARIHADERLNESTSTGHPLNGLEGGLRTKGHFKKSLPGSPLVTVITVVLNAGTCLEDSIRSVIGQNYENIEYIILDGGSTDTTLEIVRKYEDMIDYWVSESDDGIYDALNKGVKLAKGDWIYVLGADDVMLNVVHRIVNLLNRGNEIYYGDVYLPGRHEIIRGEFTRYRLMYTPMTHQGIFYPRAVFTDYSYNLKYPYAADYELEMRCFNDPRYRFVYMPILVAIYNDSDGKSAKNEDSLFLNDRKEIIRRNFPWQYYLIFSMRYYFAALLKALGVKDILKKMVAAVLSTSH